MKESPKPKRRHKKRKIIVAVIISFIVMIGIVFAGFLLLYQGSQGKLDQLKVSETKKHKEYEEIIQSAVLPEGWSAETLSTLQSAALAAYDTSLIDKVDKAFNGDASAAKELENVTSSTQPASVEKYRTIFSSLKSYPEDLIKLAASNPEYLDFVAAYTSQSQSPSQAEALSITDFSVVPNLKTFDPSWGYIPYAGTLFANSGSAPTAIAMTFAYLTDNPAFTPALLAQFAKDYGYEFEPIKDNDTIFAGAAYGYGINMIPLSKYPTPISQAISQGTVAVLQLQDGEGSKFVVVPSINEDGTWNVYDPSVPGDPKAVNPDSIQDQILSACAYYYYG
ncbi:MAG: hypothetical protein HUJ55_02280 [Ileibacterium sp.]|nr:hypothetical protein [Ileibacterium sp.]